MNKLMIVFFLCGIRLLSSQTSEPPAFIRDSLDTYVRRALQEWQIPGVAVCVIKDGKVDVMKGYGVRNMQSGQTVDEHTLFMIGSNTKAFTATALAMLEAEQKLSLDDKVKKWLPDFKLYDPWVTEEVNLRDLLCHRIGFETFQGDFLFYDSDLTADEVSEKLGLLKPLYGFRSRWGYTNAAFVVAGDVIQAADGRSWAEFIRQEIFHPLGMKRSLALSSEILTASNKASAHTIVHGELQKIPYGTIDGLAPAGSISSSVSDLSHWVMALLDNGAYDGNEVIAASAIEQTRRPHSVMGNARHPFSDTQFNLYGLGWRLTDYAGKKMVAHTGGVNGFVTGICLFPSEKLGIIVLTNTDTNAFFEALRNEIQDAYLGLPYRNYSRLFLESHRANLEESEQLLSAYRDTIALKLPADLPLKAFAGTYVHAVYGAMVISQEGDALKARFEHHHELVATLESLGGNRFLATFNDPVYGIKVWPFTIENGSVRSATVRVADFVEFLPYEFVKMN
jgi:CubicO group peptidase (beta-lactamase class C family)